MCHPDVAAESEEDALSDMCWVILQQEQQQQQQHEDSSHENISGAPASTAAAAAELENECDNAWPPRRGSSSRASSPPSSVCLSPSRSLHGGRTMLRLSIICALVSACAGWAMSAGKIGKVTDMLKKAASRPRRYGSWAKQDQCRAAPAWDADVADMRDAVDTFEAREYTPPMWARNAHLHTIVASGDMEKKLLGDRTPLGYWRERWPTPDGDFVDIDWLPAEDHDEATINHSKGDGDERHVSPPGAPIIAGVPISTERVLKEVAQLKEEAAAGTTLEHAPLGVGHPGAPEPVRKGHPSWMDDRKRGHGSQGSGSTRRLVVLLHGLEGSSTAPLTKRFSNVYARNGFDVAALNFRGCSGELGKFPMGYHLGFTDDLLHVIEELHRRFPDTWDRIYLSGFSLGGNVIVKFLGEQGDRARELGIYGASVACVPFEPQLGAEKLNNDPIGRHVYMPVFMAWLNIKAAEHAKAYPDVLSLDDIQDLKTFTQFDSRVTLPIFGFTSPEEYYSYVNAANYLSRVRIPLMVINAKDDPFIDGDALPPQEKVESAPVRLIYHAYGGHCGFMSSLQTKFTRKWAKALGSSWVPWASWVSDDSSTSTPNTMNSAAAQSSDMAASSTLVTPAAAAAGARGVRDDERASQGVTGDAGGSTALDGGDDEGEAGGARNRVLKEGRWLPTELARFVTHLDESLHARGKTQRRPSEQARRSGMTSKSCSPSPSVKS